MKNNLIRAISENGGVVFIGLDSTEIVNKMEQFHHTSAVCSAALGRLLTAGAMMGAMLKSVDDKMTLRINGGGPAGALVVVADGSGNVRGYIENPVVELPLRADGKLNVGAAVGNNGNLSVVRDLGLKEPYIGMVPLVTGEIAEDITSYYATSEQIPTACALGVLVSPDLTIQCAGGFMVQLLPGALDSEIDILESNLSNLDSITNMLSRGLSLYDIMEIVMKGFSPQILDENSAEYVCSCSVERTEGVLASIGIDELQKMLEEDEIAQVECQFCNKKYVINIRDLLKKMEET